MKSCETYQAQLLDHLYGLLEPEDSRALEEHLGACPGCQAALAHAREQKQLLAAAARSKFPGVRFEEPPAPAPAEAEVTRPVPPEAPPVVPIRTVPVRVNWGRWAVAAGVLLAVAGIGTAGSLVWGEYRGRRDQVAHAKADRERAQQEQARLQQQQWADQVRADQELRAVQ